MKNRCTLIVIACFCFQFLQAQFGQDCETAINICTKQRYKIEDMSNYGAIQERDKDATCFNSQFNETNSKWLHFHIEKGGELSFTIDPILHSDDLDFILYKVDHHGCSSKEIVRCMASGRNLGSRVSSAQCTGSTGLRSHDFDITETTGCNDSNDNFLSSVYTNEGDEYLLLINNYDNSDGFYFKIEGDVMLTPFEDCLVRPDHLSALEAFPNPVTDIARVVFFSDLTDANGRFELLDFSGKQVLIKSTQISAGQNELSIDMSEFSPGPYSFKLTSLDDHIVETVIKI